MSIAYLSPHFPSNQLSNSVIDPIGWDAVRLCFSQQRLKDGRYVCLKPTRISDSKAIVEILNGLGPESCYLRFGQARQSTQQMQHIAETIAAESNRIGRGWIAYVVGPGGRLKPVGMARYIELSNGQAEVAFTIVDEFQGLGLGTILWDKVVKSAKQANLSHLIAHVNPKNHRMLSLVNKSGNPFSTNYTSQTATMTINICQGQFHRLLAAYIPSV